MEYRKLTAGEINALEANGCNAEDWQKVEVAKDGFDAHYVRDANFYGDIRIGALDANVEVTWDFHRHAGIYDATLRNVTIGSNSLIEHIGCYISDYTIGSGCYIANTATIATTDGASYGEGSLIAVLNEAGDGNITVFKGLSSQLAAFMLRHSADDGVRNALRRLISEESERMMPDRGTIGEGVKVINTGEIVNAIIDTGCEVNGAARVSDSSICGNGRSGVYIGTDAIVDNSVVTGGSSVTEGAKVKSCFVGEACQITDAFSATQSIFFANTIMANGEACAAFCGPYSASHHKGTLLIGSQMSFYNAGSATNFSNHAYKMGPIHWGILERGTKTASGSYMLMPARVGAFSVVMGKLMKHPRTDGLPFSYLIGSDGGTTWLVPGRNITTAGTYRDIKKWQKRDMRPTDCRSSIIDYDWLSPFTIGEVLRGKAILENILKVNGDDVAEYHYHGMCIKASSLKKGIHYYDMALRLFMGESLELALEHGYDIKPVGNVGLSRWIDLGGQLMPESEEERLADDIREGNIETIQEVADRFAEIEANYDVYRWRWAYRTIANYYGIKSIDEAAESRIKYDYTEAKKEWISAVKEDAKKEYALGDVQQATLEEFIEKVKE